MKVEFNGVSELGASAVLGFLSRNPSVLLEKQSLVFQEELLRDVADRLECDEDEALFFLERTTPCASLIIDIGGRRVVYA